MPAIDIFIKSYFRDFKWLKFALQSIARNVTGYNKLILCIPGDDAYLFSSEFTTLPPRTDVRFVKEYGNGYMYQQWCKINSHKYSDAQYILEGDSDCIYTRPIDLQDYVADGRPEILCTSWDKVGDAICWKKPTEEIMGEEVPFEFMRRNNLIYHLGTLINLNEEFPNLERTIMNSARFSEFNLIGAYAYKYERHRYNFINTDNWQYTEPKAIQFWSYSSKGIDASENHLKEYIRALKTIIMGCGFEPPDVPDKPEEVLRDSIDALESFMIEHGIEPPK
jgi:hypothetical protein